MQSPLDLLASSKEPNVIYLKTVNIKIDVNLM